MRKATALLLGLSLMACGKSRGRVIEDNRAVVDATRTRMAKLDALAANPGKPPVCTPAIAKLEVGVNVEYALPGWLTGKQPHQLGLGYVALRQYAGALQPFLSDTDPTQPKSSLDADGKGLQQIIDRAAKLPYVIVLRTVGENEKGDVLVSLADAQRVTLLCQFSVPQSEKALERYVRMQGGFKVQGSEFMAESDPGKAARESVDALMRATKDHLGIEIPVAPLR